MACAPVDISRVVKQGNRLYYYRDGKAHSQSTASTIGASWTSWCASKFPMAFDFRDELDVEWAGPSQLVLPTQ
jgi:hypothetical protein